MKRTIIGDEVISTQPNPDTIKFFPLLTNTRGENVRNMGLARTNVLNHSIADSLTGCSNYTCVGEQVGQGEKYSHVTCFLKGAS